MADQLGRYYAPDRWLIMTHSDDKGLILPPKVAPVQAVLVPIYRKDEERSLVMEAAQKIASDLKIKLDSREGQSPGAKFFHWERRGVPIVLELGPRDLASGNVVLKRRDTGSKEVVPQSELGAKLEATLAQMQMPLLMLLGHADKFGVSALIGKLRRVLQQGVPCQRSLQTVPRRVEVPAQNVAFAHPPIGEEPVCRLGVGPILAGKRNALSNSAPHPDQELTKSPAKTRILEDAFVDFAVDPMEASLGRSDALVVPNES